MTAKEHNRLAGIFLMAHGGLQAFAVIIICTIYAVVGAAIFASGGRGEERVVGAAFIGFVLIIGVVASMLILPQVIGGYKLFKERANARTWGIVGSIMSCLSFPLGTAAGVYGMWFLFGDMGKQFYLGGMNQPMFQQPPQQPPPNSWQ